MCGYPSLFRAFSTALRDVGATEVFGVIRHFVLSRLTAGSELKVLVFAREENAFPVKLVTFSPGNTTTQHVCAGMSALTGIAAGLRNGSIASVMFRCACDKGWTRIDVHLGG